MPTDHPPDSHPNGWEPQAEPVGRVRRAVWLPIGFLCVVLGGIGIVVPGWPTTVFFIGAAAAFAKSSPRLEQWILDLPTIGPLVRDYRAGLGMPLRAKVLAVSMIAVAVGFSAWVIGHWVISTIVVVAGLVGILVVLRVPTKQVAGPTTS
jgi:uncharacterized membrane protein YbaN (DUF454 family)